MKKAFGMLLLTIGLSTAAFAFDFNPWDGGGREVPEIDANSIASAGALLSGALLVIRSRKQK